MRHREAEHSTANTIHSVHFDPEIQISESGLSGHHCTVMGIESCSLPCSARRSCLNHQRQGLRFK